MARYCFYCGRELISGDKCNCRSSGKTYAAENAAAGAASAGATSAGASAAGAASKAAGTSKSADSSKSATQARRKENIFRRFFQSVNPFATGAGSRQSTQAKPKQPPNYQKTRPAAKPRQPITLQGALRTLQQFGSYLTRPADSIRSSLHAVSRRFVLAILLMQGVAGGLFLMVAASQPLVKSLLTLSNATASGSINFSNSIFLFIQGFGVGVAASLLLALLYHLALKYLYRHPVAFLDLLAVFSPASLYFSIFLIAALLSLSSSVFSALLLLAAGFAIAAIAQYLAVCEVASIDDNRGFVLVTFVMLIYTSVLSLLLNLSLPVLMALLGESSVM